MFDHLSLSSICLNNSSLLFLFSGSSAEIILTQTPKAQSVVPGQTVSFRCKSSTTIGDDINWYLQKSGKTPKLLIYDTTERQSGVPDRFRATAVQTDFTLIISGVQTEDAGVYYCHLYYSNSQWVFKL
uniref:Ig-like domain-containing protein n=1 Tax=Oreochromis niloticus TaxID=8128 RepID=I3K901_ORENI